MGYGFVGVPWPESAKKISVVPSQSGSLTYTGGTLTPSWSNFDTTMLTIGGTTSATNAGTYTATFTPKEGYEWSDGTDTAKSVTWKIARAVISVPTQKGTLSYTGSVQSPSWNNYDSSKMTIGGTTSGTNTGTYTATFTPKSNYQWSDGSTAAKSVTWSIGEVSLTVPSQKGSLTYTGSSQSPAWNNYDSGKITLGGTTSGTNAGSYTATFTPKAGYKWADGTTSAKSVTWTIGKAAGSLSLNKSSMTLNVSSLTGTITATRSGTGAISASSSNTSVATVSVSGTTVTVTAKAKGSATITVSVAADANHTAPSSKTCAVTVDMPSKNLADNTPADIQAAARAGTAPDYWSVGDKIPIALNGTVGSLTLNGTYYAFIIGFNHNSSIEGNNTIHFQFGKTSDGTDIAFCDAGCDHDYSENSNSRFVMNAENTDGNNDNGWEISYMRNAICPAFLLAMPTAWQNVIAACTKYSDNRGGGANADSYVTATSDKIWLLAEFEVFGVRHHANSAEQNYQRQYDYYKNGNSKVKHKHSATTTACNWWLRSAYKGNVLNTSMKVDMSGDAIGQQAYRSIGFAPGFMVA